MFLVRYALACQTISEGKMPISPGKVDLFCLFVACSYTSMEATVLTCCFSWVRSWMPKVLWNNKLSVSLERVEWSCWFFACSFCIKTSIEVHCKNMPFWLGIFRYRLSAINIVRCFELQSWTHQADFLLLLKLQTILGYDPKILLATRFAGFFTFDLFHLLTLMLGVHCYIVLVNSVKWPYYQKDINQINFDYPTPWNLALPIFQFFILILFNVNLSFNKTLLALFFFEW